MDIKHPTYKTEECSHRAKGKYEFFDSVVFLFIKRYDDSHKTYFLRKIREIITPKTVFSQQNRAVCRRF